MMAERGVGKARVKDDEEGLGGCFWVEYAGVVSRARGDT